MGLEPQDWVPESGTWSLPGDPEKGVAARKCSVPSGSSEEGDRVLMGQEGKSGRVSPGCGGSPCQEAGSDEGEVRRRVHPGFRSLAIACSARESQAHLCYSTFCRRQGME